MENPALSTSTDKPKAKPGPKPKANPELESLQHRVEKLEAMLIEVATHAGQGAVVRKHGYPPFEFKQKSRYAS